jgi:hypothetical protein
LATARDPVSEPRQFPVGGVLPFIGAAFSVWVLIEAVYTGAVSVTVMLYGLGSIGVGAMVALFLHRIQRNEFFIQ